jgi:hypothetical protein
MSYTDTHKDINIQNVPKIKHIVMNGGGPAGLITYGAAKYLHKKGFWKLENIESIYGCSKYWMRNCTRRSPNRRRRGRLERFLINL